MQVGGLTIGGGAPVVIQSMTNTKTSDVSSTLKQIREQEAGCELVRVAVRDEEAVAALSAICRESPLPVIADIHFNYRLALAAMDAGAAKIRINPGNIGGKDRLAQIFERAGEKNIPLRIGVNAGSLEKKLREKYGGVSAEALVESALKHIRLAEDSSFREIVVSLKASSVPLTVAAYRLMAEVVDYPLHLGITEAGSEFSGTVYSAVGIGALLLDGLGDTIRVSLTASPETEIRVAKEILAAAGVRHFGPRVISCPTCGEPGEFTVHGRKLKKVAGIREPLTLAVMGVKSTAPVKQAMPIWELPAVKCRINILPR